MERNAAIASIRNDLRRRSGDTWSVTGGTGGAWGWIKITAPPRRRDKFGRMSLADARTLYRLLDLGTPNESDRQGIDVAASADHRREFADRAAGRKPSVTAKPYWD